MNYAPKSSEFKSYWVTLDKLLIPSVSHLSSIKFGEKKFCRLVVRVKQVGAYAVHRTPQEYTVISNVFYCGRRPNIPTQMHFMSDLPSATSFPILCPGKN